MPLPVNSSRATPRQRKSRGVSSTNAHAHHESVVLLERADLSERDVLGEADEV